MLRYYNKNTILLSFVFLLLPITICQADDNIQIFSNIYGTGKYKFVVLPDDTPLIPSFPLESLKNDPEIKSIEYIKDEKFKNGFHDYYCITIDAGDVTDSKVRVRYYINSSIENARILMIEALSNTTTACFNVLDYTVEDEIGDNCWYINVKKWDGDNIISYSEIGGINFIRNNIIISVGDENNYDNTAAVLAVAKKVDQALINSRKVTTTDSLKNPVINSFEIISGSLVIGTNEDVKIEIKATDPMGENLIYRSYGNALLYEKPIFTLDPPFNGNMTKKSAFWVINESHYVSLAEKEFTF